MCDPDAARDAARMPPFVNDKRDEEWAALWQCTAEQAREAINNLIAKGFMVERTS